MHCKASAAKDRTIRIIIIYMYVALGAGTPLGDVMSLSSGLCMPRLGKAQLTSGYAERLPVC